MTRQPLNLQIAGMEWSDEAVTLFEWLQQFSATDESGAIVITSAATLIARQFPAPLSPASRMEIMKLGSEFATLILEIHAEIANREAPPVLAVVGGTDV